MSPKRRPLSLHHLTINFLSNRLIEALSDDAGTHISEARKYLASSTYDSLQGLLNKILGFINLDANTRYSCLGVLLREDVKNLEIGIFPRFYYDKILETVAHQGTGLQHLSLKGVWARDYPQLLTNLVLNLKYLKTLVIPHMADDSVINAIAGLQHLVKLDVSGEACYSGPGIRLLKSDSIRILDIGSYGKINLCQDGSGPESVAELLRNLPNLNVLKTYSFTGHALRHLYEKDREFRTKLTYVHATDCDLNILNAVTKTCPHLENIHINCPRDGVVARLGEVGKLAAVKITKGDGSELKTLLRTSGSRVRALKLNRNGTSSLDLSEICERAPRIAILECYQVHLKFTGPDTIFVNLEKVQIFYCDVGGDVVKMLLRNAPFLRSLTVGCALEITDGDMFRILGECTLENLEELLLSDARFLTAITVGLLTDNCPNLRVLGSLTNWDLTQDEIEALRVLLALSNVDLTLWPKT